MKHNNTKYRSMMVPMMREAITGLLHVIEQGELPNDQALYKAVGFATAVLDQIGMEMAEAPDFVPDEEMVALYQSGLSIEDVGAKLGCSGGTVRNALKRLGAKMRKRGPARMAALYPERTADMVAMRERGATLQEIGAKYKLTRERVRQILIREGVDTSNRPLSKEDLAIVQEYLDGDSLWVVGERHKMGLTSLKSLITKAGYKIRPSPRQSKDPTIERRAKIAAELYREGMKVRDIADRIGITPRSDGGHSGGIYRLLAKENIRPNRVARRTPKTERTTTKPTKQADWSPENTKLLERLWRGGFPASYIARRLGNISRNAVLGKVRRLGLEHGGENNAPSR